MYFTFDVKYAGLDVLEIMRELSKRMCCIRDVYAVYGVNTMHVQI